MGKAKKRDVLEIFTAKRFFEGSGSPIDLGNQEHVERLKTRYVEVMEHHGYIHINENEETVNFNSLKL